MCRLSLGLLKPSAMNGKYFLDSSTTRSSISTWSMVSTNGCLATSRATPPSPPPTMSTCNEISRLHRCFPSHTQKKKKNVIIIKNYRIPSVVSGDWTEVGMRSFPGKKIHQTQYIESYRPVPERHHAISFKTDEFIFTNKIMFWG